jgi:ABC-type Zn uptake system ZnuABC Zn-binding protein ZnuA
VLCEQASVEQDPAKLHELIKEINDLLEAKEASLRRNVLFQHPSFAYWVRNDIRCCT